MMRRWPVALLFLGACWGQNPPILAEVDTILRGLSQITGWEVKRKVPSEVLTKQQFDEILEKSVKQAERDKDVHATELTLKMFGLAPWDFRLARGAADLISEQAAALYDVRKRRLYIMESLVGNGRQPDQEQRLVLAHELAHALADQQYPLGKFQDAPRNDDAATARQAVVEGQASWLSWAYLNFRSTGRTGVPARVLGQLGDTADEPEFPVLAQAPLYMRESLLFPYTEGMRFQEAVHRREGKASFDRVFRDPPSSTRQILHPEAYAEHAAPARPRLPDLERELGKQARQFRPLIDGDVGEFDFSALLRQYIDEGEGRQAAEAWRGGFFRLYGHKQEKYPLLAFISEWESPAAAGKFFELYKRVLRAKWKRLQVHSDSPAEIRGAGDTGDFLLRLDGRTVYGLEGLGGSPQTRGLVR